MKRFKFSSFILASAMFLSAVSYTSVPVYAEDEPSSSDNGMVISKTAKSNGDGTYKITLEAYATGSKIITDVTKDAPTDIVLVLDQSGSMSYTMSSSRYDQYTDKTNEYLYSVRYNQSDLSKANLYYPLSNSIYATVSVTVSNSSETFVAQSVVRNNINEYWVWSKDEYRYIKYPCTNLYENRDNLYVKVNNEYVKVTVSTSSRWGNKTYSYIINDNQVIASAQDNDGEPVISDGMTDDKLFYVKTSDPSQNKYTYTYTDENDEIHTIGFSIGDDKLNELGLYRKISNERRIDALIRAVSTFVNEVNKKANGDLSTTEDDINHRIAIVGFSSYDYHNTELLTGSTLTEQSISQSGTSYYPQEKEINGPNYYHGITTDQYANALQNMNTTSGVENVNAAIKAITAHGGTQIQTGIEMANNIFKNNPIPENEKRNRVVIVFTDGAPGDKGDWANASREVANSAIDEAYKSKHTYDATVYSVGIFDGADASNPGALPSYTSSGNISDAQKTANSNRFMHLLSSNYLDAKSMLDEDKGDLNPKLKVDESYYLSAGDSDSLNDIFKKISDQIESGGSSTTLGEETVIKDIISPQFKLPEGATTSNITLETSACTGIDENGEYTWSNNLNNMGATASIIDNEISVTGFDFSANYVGTVTQNGVQTYRGNKLVISFDVVPKPGFLGGNNVFTNTSASVYENADATDPVLIFERPQVNVPINDVTVTTTNKNVYLYNGITKDEVLSGSAVKCGNVALNIFEDNFGLQSWQTEYVDIDVVVSDGNGNKITNITNLSEDQVYTVSVLVKPKSGGAGADGSPAVAKSKNSNVVVNVFKPVVTFKDTHVFYGEAVPNTDNYSTENYVSTTWQHGSSPNVVKDTEVTMLGTAPTLNFEYTPDSKKFVDGKINSKEDIGVDVATKINGLDITQYVTYDHKKCEGKTCPKENFEFLLHVDTGILTINKIDGTQGEPYVFTVLKDGTKYTETTIVCDSDGKGTATIKELPAGNYTVVEDTNWSWRYKEVTDNSGNKKGPTVTYDGSNESASIKSGKTTANADVTNKKTFEYWLNGFSDVVRNVFGQLHN